MAACGTGWHDHLGPKEEMLQSSKLGSSNIRVLEAGGLAGLAGLARLARLARLAGVAGRRIATTKSNTLDAQERSADFTAENATFFFLFFCGVRILVQLSLIHI